MNWLDIILDIIIGKGARVIPKVMPMISNGEVNTILRTYTSNIWLSDGMFRLVDTENLRAFLKSDAGNNKAYVAEVHDCDDYSYELMGRVSEWNSDNTFGLVWGLNVNGDAHAWNFFVDENKKVKYVEPQNDNIFDPTTEKIWIMIV